MMTTVSDKRVCAALVVLGALANACTTDDAATGAATTGPSQTNGGFVPTVGGSSQGIGGADGGGTGGSTGASTGGTTMLPELPPEGTCAEGMALYSDGDGDGYGAGASSMTAMACEVPAGYSLVAGDCDDMDGWLVGGEEAVCGDYFDDNCDASDDGDPCPETQAGSINVPDWDCTSAPPSNVYAYAKFASGTSVSGANWAPGACVALFEGSKDLFYAKWYKFGPKTVSDDCTAYDGCICPEGGLPANNWDRRLYAYTWTGEESCPHITLIDHGNVSGGSNNAQAVSNECRKYLYALHGEGDVAVIAPDGQPAFDLPFSYVAGDLPTLERRIAQFPEVAVECSEVDLSAGAGLVTVAFAQLASSPIQLNAGFVKQQ